MLTACILSFLCMMAAFGVLFWTILAANSTCEVAVHGSLHFLAGLMEAALPHCWLLISLHCTSQLADMLPLRDKLTRAGLG